MAGFDYTVKAQIDNYYDKWRNHLPEEQKMIDARLFQYLEGVCPYYEEREPFLEYYHDLKEK